MPICTQHTQSNLCLQSLPLSVNKSSITVLLWQLLLAVCMFCQPRVSLSRVLVCLTTVCYHSPKKLKNGTFNCQPTPVLSSCTATCRPGFEGTPTSTCVTYGRKNEHWHWGP